MTHKVFTFWSAGVTLCPPHFSHTEKIQFGFSHHTFTLCDTFYNKIPIALHSHVFIIDFSADVARCLLFSFNNQEQTESRQSSVE